MNESMGLHPASKQRSFHHLSGIFRFLAMDETHVVTHRSLVTCESCRWMHMSRAGLAIHWKPSSML